MKFSMLYQIIIASFLIISSVVPVMAMEKPNGKEVTLLSKDGQEVVFSLPAAQLSITVKNMLKELESEGPVFTPIKLDTLEKIKSTLERIVKDLTPRPDYAGGGYVTREIQEIVDDEFDEKNVDRMINVLNAANYLDIPFLINAVARVFVDNFESIAQSYVDGKAPSIKIVKDIGVYLKKHLILDLSGDIYSDEMSIADLIALTCKKKDCQGLLGNILFKQQGDNYALSINGDVVEELTGTKLTSLDGIDNLAQMLQGKKITTISLSFNNLTNFRGLPGFANKPFKSFNLVEILMLDDNKLYVLPGDFFEGLSSIKRIELSGNNLSTLPKNIFKSKSFGKIEMIDLGENEFEQIPDALKDIESLKTLAFTGNKLKSVPEWIGELKNLTSLFLRYNKFSGEEKKGARKVAGKKITMRF